MNNDNSKINKEFKQKYSTINIRE